MSTGTLDELKPVHAEALVKIRSIIQLLGSRIKTQVLLTTIINSPIDKLALMNRKFASLSWGRSKSRLSGRRSRKKKIRPSTLL